MATRNRIVINALGVCVGGGKVLLLDLIKAIENDTSRNFSVWLDSRVKVSQISNPNTEFLYRNVSGFGRIKAEWSLNRYLEPTDLLICLNNLPTIWAPPCKNAVFVQNRAILAAHAQPNLSLKEKLRLEISNYWLTKGAKHVSMFVVQTPSMKRLMPRNHVHIETLAFAPNLKRNSPPKPRPSEANDYSFIFPAAAYSHKNHLKLIEAWSLLATQGIKPSLNLTIHPNEIQHNNLPENVRFLGDLDHERLLSSYGQSDALIFPSTCESFGLPLIEAVQVGLPILASDLDFVDDVCKPSQKFDPSSPESIAESVKKFIFDEIPIALPELKPQIKEASQFLNQIIEKLSVSRDRIDF